MLTFLTGAVCLLIVVSAPAHWTLVQAAFRLVCHQHADRCLTIAGATMPVCARCAGIYFGGFAALLLRVPDRPLSARRWLIAAAALMALDWASEAAGLRPAWAPLRVATGLLLGLAAAPSIVAGADAA